MPGEDSDTSGSTDRPSDPRSDRDGAEAYTVRGFRREDRQAYLDLHRRTFEGDSTTEWFAWKYESNPFVDDVPITVAEADGELVGAVSAFPLRMHTGVRSVLVYVSCEGFVHPDHRRQGLFTRMVRTAWERYADEMAFVTGLTANEKTLSAHVKYNDWRLVATIPRYYRFQRPDVLFRSRTECRLSAALRTVANPAARGYLRVRAGLGGTAAADVSIERHDDPPIESLTSLYRDHVPAEIHTIRDETLYGWRFGNPDWEYIGYVARDGSPVAAVVVGTRTIDGVTHTRLVDVLPLHAAGVESALESLLGVALEDHDDSALVRVLPGMLPDRVLSTFGFVSQGRFPFSRLFSPIYHGVRQLEGPPRGPDISLDRLTDPSNWRLSYVEHDAS